MKAKLILSLLLLNAFKLIGQDIFNEENTYKYAKNLMCNGYYEQAVVAIEPFVAREKPDTFSSLYIHSLYQQGYKEKLFNKVTELLQKKSLDTAILNQIASICLESDSGHLLRNHWQILPDDLPIRYLILQGNTDSLSKYLGSNRWILDSAYYQGILQKMVRTQVPFQKKYLLSAILLPGSGKMLLGNTYEGLLNFFLIGSHAYLSVYSFQKYGTNSLFGYTNLFMGMCFYGGNIWGTYKTAQRKQNFELQSIKNEIKKNLYTSYYRFDCE